LCRITPISQTRNIKPDNIQSIELKLNPSCGNLQQLSDKIESQFEGIISSLVKDEETSNWVNFWQRSFSQTGTAFPIPIQQFAIPVTGFPINSARSPGPVPSDKNSHIPVPAGPSAVNKSKRLARILLYKGDPGTSLDIAIHPAAYSTGLKSALPVCRSFAKPLNIRKLPVFQPGRETKVFDLLCFENWT
jgi:hypothetical protein